MNEAQRELLESAYRYILRLSNGVAQEAELRRLKKTEDMSNILLISEGVQYLVKSIYLISNTETFNEMDVIYQKANDILSSLVEIIKNNDHILLVDVLEYELYPLLAEWKEYFFKMLNS